MLTGAKRVFSPIGGKKYQPFFITFGLVVPFGPTFDSYDDAKEYAAARMKEEFASDKEVPQK